MYGKWERKTQPEWMWIKGKLWKKFYFLSLGISLRAFVSFGFLDFPWYGKNTWKSRKLAHTNFHFLVCRQESRRFSLNMKLCCCCFNVVAAKWKMHFWTLNWMNYAFVCFYTWGCYETLEYCWKWKKLLECHFGPLIF